MIISKVHAERSRFDDLFADNSLHFAAIHVCHVNFAVLVAIFLVPIREIKIAEKKQKKTIKNRVVKIVKFSTCPGTSKWP